MDLNGPNWRGWAEKDQLKGQKNDHWVFHQLGPIAFITVARTLSRKTVNDGEKSTLSPFKRREKVQRLIEVKNY